jgi:dihydrofolate reductase
VEKTKIIAVAATTLDGRIAAYPGHFSDWTSLEDKDLLHGILDQSDLVVVGHNTYKTAIGPLAKRNCLVFSRSLQGIEQRNEKLTFCNPEKINMHQLLNKYKNVVVLGGTQIYTYFLEKDWLQEIYLTIEPLVFGNGLPLFESKKWALRRFALLEVRKLNNSGSVLLHYKLDSI